MKKQLWLVPCSLSLASAMLSGSICWGAVASLSDWTGNLNTSGNNNYTVISPTSAGGTFQSRVSPVPTNPPPENWYLRDATLTGGPLGFDESLSMSGKITIANPNNADPSWFFGWYSSTDLRYRLGIAAADSTLGANNLRLQANYGNGGVITSANLTTDGTNTAANANTPNGTYDFTFAYTPGPSNNLTVHVAPTGSDWRRENLTLNFATADKFDRFGFLQFGNSAADTTTFGVTVSDINYTGETQLVPEPTSLIGIGLVLSSMVCLLRRR